MLLPNQRQLAYADFLKAVAKATPSKTIHEPPEYLLQLAALANTPDATFYLAAIRMALERGVNIPKSFHDHPLKGKLSSMRSVIIGEIDDANPSFILLYRPRGEVFDFLLIDQHDDAYSKAKKPPK